MLIAVEAAAAEVVEGLTFSGALTALLTTESLLFAALNLAASLSTPGGRRIRRLPLPGRVIGGGAVGALILVAVGALAAWAELFLCDFPTALSGILIAVALLVAIVAQPVLAVLLALGLRTAQ